MGERVSGYLCALKERYKADRMAMECFVFISQRAVELSSTGRQYMFEALRLMISRDDEEEEVDLFH